VLTLVRALILVSSGGFTPKTLFNRLFIKLKGTSFITRKFDTRFAKFYLKRRTPFVDRMIAVVDKGLNIPSRVAVDAAMPASNRRLQQIR
jgi:hypothetical protein